MKGILIKTSLKRFKSVERSTSIVTSCCWHPSSVGSCLHCCLLRQFGKLYCPGVLLGVIPSRGSDLPFTGLLVGPQVPPLLPGGWLCPGSMSKCRSMTLPRPSRGVPRPHISSLTLQPRRPHTTCTGSRSSRTVIPGYPPCLRSLPRRSVLWPLM